MLLSKCYVHDINKVPKVCDYNDIPTSNTAQPVIPSKTLLEATLEMASGLRNP
jgi:hypothetical protein